MSAAEDYFDPEDYGVDRGELYWDTLYDQAADLLSLSEAHFALWDNECLDSEATCPVDGRVGKPTSLGLIFTSFTCIKCGQPFAVPKVECLMVGE